MSSNWKETIEQGLKNKLISARKLAQQAGLSISTIHNILNTEGFDPRISTLEKACGLLDINITFGHDYMTFEKLLALFAEKSWGDPVTGKQYQQILDLIKTPAHKPLLDKFLSASSYEAFSKLLRAWS